jgi:hypothetical protein
MTVYTLYPSLHTDRVLSTLKVRGEEKRDEIRKSRREAAV